MATKAEKAKAEEEASEQNTEGPVATPAEEHAGAVAAQAAPPAPNEPVENPEGFDAHAADDGVENVELGPAVLGSFVQILEGDYAGHFAAYLGNVEVDKETGEPTIIQVRTRDADNMILNLPYDEVTSTTYSGGR